ncbi:MAG: hypothetical protein ABIK07_10710 [Planctomycetota bacterium]
MSQSEEQMIQTDLDALGEIGEEVAILATDMSYGEEDRIEIISNAIRHLKAIKRRFLWMAQH